MVEWVVPILVAVIGGPIVVLVQKLRDENSSQHAEARNLLHQVAHKVDKVDEKLDNHIDWHLTKRRKSSEAKKN